MVRNKSAAEKKAEVLGDSKKKLNSRMILLGGLVLVLALGLGLASVGRDKTAPAPSRVAADPAPGSGKGLVSYQVEMFEDGQAHYFEHVVNEKITIRYFVLKSSDGVLRAAFDACDVCWPANLGYAQEGDEMICRNCGRRFPSVRINEVQGGCNPAPLKRRVEDGQLIITLEDILSGAGYFDFSKRG